MRLSPFFVWQILFSTWPGQVIVVLVGLLVLAAAIANSRITAFSVVVPLAGCYAAVRLVRGRRRRR